MTTANKQFNINFNTGDVLGLDGEILMTQPSISYQSQPNFELHFVDIDAAGNLNPVDVSDAVSWSSALDVDFNDETEPMVRTLPSSVIASGAASGIVIFPLDANTTTFHDKINGRQSLQCWVEFRGRNSEDKIIYDYKFRIAALGAIDGTEGTPLPPVSGSVTMADVYALLRAQIEYEFSEDAENWHSTQTADDTYYRTRYPEGAWSEAIALNNGRDGYNVQFRYSANGSDWHNLPVSSDFYMSTSNDGGTTWTSAILYHGQNGTNGTNGVGFTLLGEYDGATTYHPYSTNNQYEVVTYNGSTYAYVNETASSGHAPTGSSDSYWQLLAAKGDPGSVDNITVSDITDFNSTMSGILSSYANTDNVYTISQTNDLLNAKANADNVYTQNEADDRFVDTDEFETAVGNLVTLPQWNNKNAQLQGEIDYLSGQISGGGGDLSDYTPLSTTQTVSGYLQNEINNISGNIPSSSIEGVNLNNERTLTVSNVAWVLAMPMRTTMPNANDTEQDFMFYVGETNATYTKAHLYEKVADASATPPEDDDLFITIPDFNIDNVQLEKTNGYWYGEYQYGTSIKVYTKEDSITHCEKRYVIEIGGSDVIMSDNNVSDELPWNVYPWILILNGNATPVTMTHIPHGGSGARTYHWLDISPWASNS